MLELLPDSPAYDEAWTPPIARFRNTRPELVLRCAGSDDVAAAIALVRRERQPFAVRSGGHDFAGRSSTTGVLIDVGPIDHVRLAGSVATIGAGARLGRVYDALDEHGVTIAGGCGPTVGIAGLTLGGGLGVLGRKYGLTSDQLVGAEVVLADGCVVECDEEHHPDLFWALQGAGASRFGVVTELRFRVLAVPAATTIHLTWPAAAAAQALAAWQDHAPDAPDEMAASLVALVPSDVAQPPSIHVFGAMLGTEAEAAALLEPLIAAIGAEPATRELNHLAYRAAKRHLADEGPGDIAADDGHAFSKSEFFRRPLPRPAIDELVAHLLADRRPGEARTLDFMPWGGAYNRVRPDATAFVHRAERFMLKHEVVVTRDARPSREWLQRSWSIVHPYGSGGVYPNFPDPDVGDEVYLGANLPRVQEVKRVYDPADLFTAAPPPVSS